MKPSNVLNTLHRLTQEVGRAANLQQALTTLVSGLRRAMNTEVCTIYLPDPRVEGGWEMRATDGLNAESVGQVHLGPGEGLVGLVAREEEPVNLDNAGQHPLFRYFPETGEERFPAFLGVPILHRGEVLGVICVQGTKSERFDEEHATLLFTAAAQLGGVIAHAQVLERLGHRSASTPETEASGASNAEAFLAGQGGAQGITIGTAWAVYPPADLSAVADRTTEDPEGDKREFYRALNAADQEMAELGGNLSERIDEEDADLIHAYLHILRDKGFQRRVEARIDGGSWVQAAVRDVVWEYIETFENMDDPYLRERAADMRDLGRRLISHLQQGNHRYDGELPPDTVLVGEEISPLNMASVPEGHLKGVISATGSAGSHVAILAHAFGIPAVMGIEDLPVALIDGKTIVVDGYSGRVYVDPSAKILEEYKRLEAEEAALTERLGALRDEPAVTLDGRSITLYANTGLLADLDPALRSGAEGIGLYRTELPFLTRDRFPGEAEQVRIYRQVFETFAPRPVTIRTLDIGGDKLLPYLPVHEDNPFLGWRGLRLSLDHPEIFLTQLRAILRAAPAGNVRLLLPMVTTVEELDEALGLIERARKELAALGESAPELPVGAMIEVPSAVFQTAAIARRVNFLSIGTNDLTQYLLAVDRNNARVAGLFDSLHPAVLHAIGTVVAEAHAEGRPVSVCGEMAADPVGALLLVGMGVDELSMSAGALLRIKWVLRSFSTAQTRELAELARNDECTRTTRERVEEALLEAGLGSLIRAGD
ncbi:phosphoenolpyruvate--protein phosphotransferase [Thiohalorhabdus methylotrophus]|uniref:phosphoenolpyruvate--protein phosphotransferase n=1 Tax=Thiohalorhabdus methylotrophus TaxID=3242694 RepID=A0ABV4TZ56_9GAMM